MSTIIELKLNGDGAWPDLADKMQAGKLIHIANGATVGMSTLEAGMASGRPSVALRFDLPDGRTVVAEMSWRSLAVAVQAIAARYGWPE